MKHWFLAFADIPGEVISLLILLLISFVSWLKNRVSPSQDEPWDPEEDPHREVIWKRQTGQETEGHPWETASEPPPIPPVAPPPLPPQSGPAPATPSWQRPERPTISRKEIDLAAAFERSTRRGSRGSAGRSHHRREVVALLRSPSAAQNAVLLREILGPPVALRTDSGDQPT